MLQTIIESLSREKREKLHEFGVDSSLLSRWKTGKRLPTEVQAVFLADLVGEDRHKLQDEIALLRATPEQLPLLQRVMGKAGRGAVAMLFYGVVGAAVFASGGSEAKAPDSETMYIPRRKKRQQSFLWKTASRMEMRCRACRAALTGSRGTFPKFEDRYSLMTDILSLRSPT